MPTNLSFFNQQLEHHCRGRFHAPRTKTKETKLFGRVGGLHPLEGRFILSPLYRMRRETGLFSLELGVLAAIVFGLGVWVVVTSLGTYSQLSAPYAPEEFDGGGTFQLYLHLSLLATTICCVGRGAQG